MPTMQQVAEQAQRSGMFVSNEEQFLTALIPAEAAISVTGVRIVSHDYLDVAMGLAEAARESFSIPKS